MAALLASIVLVGTILSLAGCAPARAPHAPHAASASTRDSLALIAAMHDYDRWLLGMKADSIAAAYTPDGVIVAQRDTIARGPAAIAKFLHTFDGKAQVLADTSALDSIAIDGDRARITGVYRQKAMLLPERRVVDATGRFHASWVRSADGVWRLQTMQTEPIAPGH